VSAVPALRSLLEDGGVDELGESVRPLRILRRIGEEEPAEIAPAAEAIGWYVDVPLGPARHEATRALAAVAEEHPEDAVGAVPGLRRALELSDGEQAYAVFALCRIAREFPGAVEPAAGVLEQVVLDDELADGVRLNATAALGRVAKGSPDAAVDIVEEVLDLLEAGNERLRANAAGLLADVAAVHTDLLEPHVGRVAGLLADDDPHARANATCVLSRVAEDFPGAVADRVAALVERLDDDEAVVRKRACRALGRLEAADAAPPLWERARNDEDREVRDQAQWALARIEGVD
jgi:HEAT repeat protein